jgi:hypothetical protein
MGRKKGMLSSLQDRFDGFFYKCGYLKDCDKVSPNADTAETATAANTRSGVAKKLT